MFYIFDNQGNVVNEGNGVNDYDQAVKMFKDYCTEEEAKEYGFTLCEVAEEDGCWTEVVEEYTADDIF